VEEG
jgi:hypothetical protein